MIREAAPVDTRIEIVTPENIAFEYRVAGPFRRLPAYLIDLVIQATAVMIVAIAIMFAAFGGRAFLGFGMAGYLIFLFVLQWFYGGLFEAFWNGQTPGKRLVGIRVLSIDGQPISGAQAILRNVLRAVDAMPTFTIAVFAIPTYLLGLVVAATNSRFQRLGDIASGTMVVLDDSTVHFEVIKTNEPAIIQLAAQLPVNFTPTRDLGRALALYMQRRASLTWETRSKVAWTLAEPLRERFGLPPGIHPDLLLCATYYRSFVADRGLNERRGSVPNRPTNSYPLELLPMGTPTQAGVPSTMARPPWRVGP